MHTSIAASWPWWEGWWRFGQERLEPDYDTQDTLRDHRRATHDDDYNYWYNNNYDDSRDHDGERLPRWRYIKRRDKRYDSEEDRGRNLSLDP
jgi:hypothetical protein